MNKINQTVTKFLLASDKFMPEMHLRPPGFTYSACGPFTKHKQRIQKFIQAGDTIYIYKNEPDQAAYSNSKDLAKRTQSDKVLKDKVFEIANNPKCDGYQTGLASMVYKFFDKRNQKELVLKMK